MFRNKHRREDARLFELSQIFAALVSVRYYQHELDGIVEIESNEKQGRFCRVLLTTECGSAGSRNPPSQSTIGNAGVPSASNRCFGSLAYSFLVILGAHEAS